MTAGPMATSTPAQFRADIALLGSQPAVAPRRACGAIFAVRRLLRRIDTFGFHLATLDLRQHTDVHHAVLAQGLDDPAMAAARPRRAPCRGSSRSSTAIRARAACSTRSGRRTLAVFDAMMQGRGIATAPMPSGSTSSAAPRGADDVLAPLVLARWASADDNRTEAVPLDVAPQFDSSETLRMLCRSCAKLLQDPLYRAASGGPRARADVPGRLFRQQPGQRARGRAPRGLPRAAQPHRRPCARRTRSTCCSTRAAAACRAAAVASMRCCARRRPNAVSGMLRFTEQGESISQNYGLQADCHAHAGARLQYAGAATQPGARWGIG